MIRNMRSACQRTLLEVVVLEGDGTKANVAREVTYYLTLEGVEVARCDPGKHYSDYGPTLAEEGGR